MSHAYVVPQGDYDSKAMQTRFIRLAVAIFVLIGALMTGSISHASACSEAAAGEQTIAIGADVDGRDSHHGPQDFGSESGAGALEPELLCHSVSAGCSGCLTPAWLSGPALSTSRLAFPLSDNFDRSIASTDNFRPPITLL
jgi:hypothetical protein